MSSPDSSLIFDSLHRILAEQGADSDRELVIEARRSHLCDFACPGVNNAESLQLFVKTYHRIQQLWEAQGISSDVSLMLWLYWLPLAEAIAAQYQSLSRPMIQGVLGGQGTGKTTLCKVLLELLGYMGISAQALSIDDLYKTYADRQELLKQDPRLVWRGPPGTHDVALGLDVFDQFFNGDQTRPLEVPQFDKYAFDGQGDRTFPLLTPKPDILLFEGWFVGARPLSLDKFSETPEPILTEADRQFALDMNQALEDYLPLWDKMDALLVLNPEDYHLSLTWRWEAESKAIAQGKTGMSEADITAFVQYFWKALHPQLFIPELLSHDQWVDYVLEINANHQPVKLYSPAS